MPDVDAPPVGHQCGIDELAVADTELVVDPLQVTKSNHDRHGWRNYSGRTPTDESTGRTASIGSPMTLLRNPSSAATKRPAPP